MIAALLLRLGIPMWAAKLVLLAIVLATLTGSALAYRHHVYSLGEAAADARAAAREAANSKRAQDELVAINDRLAKAQADLDTAVKDLVRMEMELSYEKRNVTALQSDLAAGHKRLRVLVRQRPADPTKPAESTCSAGVDPGAPVVADIDPAVAADLVGLAAEGDQAIIRLNACIAAFDAVKKAADTP